MQFVVEALLSLVIWVFVFPVAWVLSTPIILISSVFAKGPYWTSVKKKYGAVTRWCGNWGWALSP
jgi:hypothetical protein